MANRNRTEVAAAIEALAAIVDLEELKEALNDFFAQSCVFRKDVSSALTPLTGTPSIDFTDIDYISADVSPNTFTSYTFNISGVQQGEIKYLLIIKTAGDSVSFSGATDIGPGSSFIDSKTSILYRLTNKDGSNIIAEPLSKLFSSTDWQNPIFNANFSAGTNPLQYRLYQNKLEFRGEMDVVGTSGTAFVLPSGYRPIADAFLMFSIVGAATDVKPFIVRSTGVVTSSDWLDSGTGTNYFNNTIILD